MKESTIKILSLFISLVGIVLLYYISFFLGPQPTPIKSIDEKMVGFNVFVCGNISYKYTKNNHIFMNIKDGDSSIRFVIFNTSINTLARYGISPNNLSINKSICVGGVVDEYPPMSGNMEIVYRGGKIDVH